MFNSSPPTVESRPLAPSRPVMILRIAATLRRRGRSRSAHYADIKDGLFVHPIRIGLRAAGTPDYEVHALIAARIAGKSDDEIRELVLRLEAARKAAV